MASGISTLSQNMAGKKGTSTKATHHTAFSDDSEHHLHNCLSTQTAVNVMHSKIMLPESAMCPLTQSAQLGHWRHCAQCEAECSAIHDLEENTSTNCQLLGTCLCCQCDAHDIGSLIDKLWTGRESRESADSHLLALHQG